MAQAARLSLRMHKEIKLLLSDPPHGASFPSLSSSSLTTIDAQIEGPKGTVYETGYFQIKIQIPERYPFQPPVVTFATPIYHPNIDTGGRICLDILNLPPKGAWQPSLNISTVITSIGLLLSEPNPDDGLMCEASKEYKYNRQAFDQKARSMTDKYAKAFNRNEDVYINSNSSQGNDKDFKHEVRAEVINLKIHSVSRKLSLQSSGSSKNSNDKRLPDQPKFAPPDTQIEVEHRLESKYNLCNSNGNDEKLPEMRKKLSLERLCQSRKTSSDETGAMSHTVVGGSVSHQDAGFYLGAKAPMCQKFPEDCSGKMLYGKSTKIQQLTQPKSTDSCSFPNMANTRSLKSLEVNRVELEASQEDKYLKENKLTMGRPCNKKLKENTKEDNKENIPLVALHQTTPETTYRQPGELHVASSSVIGKNVSEITVNSELNSSCKHQGINRRLSLRPLQSLQANHEARNEVNVQTKGAGQKVRGESEVHISNEAIVMDSEDEEEKEPARQKVMVAHRRLCLARKRKEK